MFGTQVAEYRVPHGLVNDIIVVDNTCLLYSRIVGVYNYLQEFGLNHCNRFRTHTYISHQELNDLIVKIPFLFLILNILLFDIGNLLVISKVRAKEKRM